MTEVNPTEKIRIKDIAEQAGVSVGTVDRVLHGRPNVSEKARIKVENVLKDINYQPNMYASALASNKRYKFQCILPAHDQDAYWSEVEGGLQAAIEKYNDFHFTLNVNYYDQFHPESFAEASENALKEQPDGMIIVPQEHNVTASFCTELNRQDIPFILLDSNMPDLKALTFYGQDPLKSGRFAARILMLTSQNSSNVVLIKFMKNNRIASKQQEFREIGFRQYMLEHHPDNQITELIIQLDGSRSYSEQLERFFIDHPLVKNGITFSSLAYIPAEYLLRKNRRDFSLVGYDMIDRNMECLQKGAISFLIAQHPWRQGYDCVKTMFNHVVLKQEIPRDNYMPIELLSAENYIYYLK
ncbi:MAG: LacI family DNA-binding transcriptional regulator [Clostridium sp.]|nr:LacI family DNA-binding transcriptional regulator [Clostridium sp.]